MIRSETAGGPRVARIRFDRIDKKNAITAEMYAMPEPLSPRRTPTRRRARCSCTARRTASPRQRRGRFPQRAPPARRLAARAFDTLPRMKKPVVARSADRRSASARRCCSTAISYTRRRTRFQLPFVPLGIVPEFGSTLLLSLIAGQRAALLLLGQPFTAQEAYEAGIVTEVVAQEKLLQHAFQVATALALCHRNPSASPSA